MPETMTRERPILFSGAMVRAILAGAKTQTRRVILGTNGEIGPLGGLGFPVKGARGTTDFKGGPALFALCPYGAPGDRLWVRETWGYFGGDEYLYQQERASVGYRAALRNFVWVSTVGRLCHCG